MTDDDSPADSDTSDNFEVTLSFESKAQAEFAVSQLLFSAENIEETLGVFEPAVLDDDGRTEEDSIEVHRSIANQIDDAL